MQKPPSSNPPTKAYMAAARQEHGPPVAPASQSMGHERPAKGRTPYGLPVRLLPWHPTPCTAGSWCRSNLPSAVRTEWAQGFGWYTMSPPQNADTLLALSADLEPYEWQAQTLPPDALFVQGTARQMVQKMYEGTNVAGAVEKVPPKLRGVFWMKSNGVGEELVSLQFGSYSEEQKTLLSPLSPFSWGWPNGKPAEAPFDGKMYMPSLIEGGAKTLLNQAGRSVLKTPATSTYKFASQPDNGSKSFARMDAFVGDTRVSILNGWGYTDYGSSGKISEILAPCWPITQQFTLEELESENGNASLDGRAWFRGIKWGCYGVECIPFGGYTLLKVLDGEGNPVQPAYDEFIQYMGDVPIWTWAGTPNSA